MKIAVITANFGKYDSVKPIPKQSVKFDRFYFNENNNPFPSTTLNNRSKAKVYKMLMHKILPSYDIYVWIDASIRVKSSKFISNLIRPLKDDDSLQFNVQKHPHRSNVYEEAKFIVDKILKGSKTLSNKFTATYIGQELNYLQPQLEGLYACGIFARSHSMAANEMCEQWFIDTVLWSSCDQMSFVNNLTKFDLKFTTYNFGNFYDNIFYKIEPHVKV